MTTSTNHPSVDTAHLNDYIKHSAALEQPMFIWGSPGIGKSTIVAQAADEMGATLVDIRLSQYESVDLRGLPDVDSTTGQTVWRVPSTLPFVGSSFDIKPTKAKPAKPIILFLDEAMQAPPSVQAVVFQLVLDRRIGEHHLLPNVHIIAASNRETDKAGTSRMLSPLANRFIHIEASPSTDGWVKWARSVGVPAPVEAYIRFRPDNLDRFSEANAANAKAFATPRSWATVGKIVRTMLHPDTNAPDNRVVFNNLIAATVGNAVSAEFLAFLHTWATMPDLKNIFANPTTAEVPTEPSMLFAVTAALAHHAVAATGADREAKLKALVEYSTRVPKEYQVKTMLDLVQRDTSLAGHPVMSSFIRDNSHLLIGSE